MGTFRIWLTLISFLLLVSVRLTGNIEQGGVSQNRQTYDTSEDSRQNVAKPGTETKESVQFHQTFPDRKILTSKRPKRELWNKAGNVDRIQNKSPINDQNEENKGGITKNEDSNARRLIRGVRSEMKNNADRRNKVEVQGRGKKIGISQKYKTELTDDVLDDISKEMIGNPCVASPCLHGGTCKWQKKGSPSFLCACKLGYRGKRCEQELQECEDAPCNDKGDCIATPAGFLCLCRDGYGGRFCEIRDRNRKYHRKEITVGRIVIQAETVHMLKVVILVVIFAIGTITLFLSIHCYRVLKKRQIIQEEFKTLLANGGEITSFPPDMCDISNELCRKLFCQRCSRASESIEFYESLKIKNVIKHLKSEKSESSHSETSLEERPLVSKSSSSPRKSSISHRRLSSHSSQRRSDKSIRSGTRSSIRSVPSVKKTLSRIPEGELTSDFTDASPPHYNRNMSSRNLPRVKYSPLKNYTLDSQYSNNQCSKPHDVMSETSFDSHQLTADMAYDQMMYNREIHLQNNYSNGGGYSGNHDTNYYNNF